MILDGHFVQVFIPGAPVPKARPRFRVVKGHVMTYTPKTTEKYEQFVAECIRKEFPDYKTYLGYIHLDIKFNMPVPQSLRLRYHTRDCSLLKENYTIIGSNHLVPTPYKPCVRCKPKGLVCYVPVLPKTKPDLDNLEKSIMDGFQKSEIIKDDSQVTSKMTSKVYSEHPGVVLGITFGGYNASNGWVSCF